MSETVSFQALMGRVRSGEEDAAAELVRLYEPAVRRAVRFRMADSRLGRAMDSLDVCQSVLGSFFVRAALGQYVLDQPEQLVRLLTTMVRNKLANQVHHERARRRDHRRVAAPDSGAWENLAGGPSPSRQVAARELLEETQRRLTAEERRLLELRQKGGSWEQIATEIGGSPEALRKKLARAVDRVATELGWDG